MTSISILHCNVRSLKHKTGLLDMYLIDKEFDIVCVTEHWCKPDEINTLPITNYKCVTNYSRSVSSGGGAAIFVKNLLCCTT